MLGNSATTQLAILQFPQQQQITVAPPAAGVVTNNPFVMSPGVLSVR